MKKEISNECGVWATDLHMQAKIARVVAKLPTNVCRFATSKIDYFCVGKRSGWIGQTIYTRNKWLSPWLIILSDTAPQYTIAHEIAHVWLKHNKQGSLYGNDEAKEKQEGEANTLAKEWGFNRNRKQKR